MPKNTGKIVTLPVTQLIEYGPIYPRNGVNSNNITRLAEALQAGVELPPIIASDTNYYIVDGWHRKLANMRVYGDTAVVQVELRSYANEAEMFKDAVSLNSSHGRQLDQRDQIRCITLADAMGISTQRISVALGIEEVVTIKLRQQVATAPMSAPGVLPIPVRIAPTKAEILSDAASPPLLTGYLPLKRSVGHLNGTTLSIEQAQAIRSAPGPSYSMHISQLRDAVKYSLINDKDEKLMQSLQELRDILIDYFETA